MDFRDIPMVKQVEVTTDAMAALRKELGYAQGDAFFSASGRDLPKESFNRKILVASHEEGRLAAEKQLQAGKSLVVVSSQGFAAQPLPIPAVSALKEIFFPQLEVSKRHHGRVLFGTFCVKPFKISSVNTLLADKSGKAVRVVIYNVATSVSSRELEDHFPRGIRVAIKEPYFRLCADGKVAVRVENPAEVVIMGDPKKEVVGDNSKLPPPPSNAVPALEGLVQEIDKIRGEGNRLFSQQNWSRAIAEYSKCIARSSSAVGAESEDIKRSLVLAFSNRAEAWLQLQNFKNALDDANKALEIDIQHAKSISRRDRAWQGFGKVLASPFSTSVESKVPSEHESIAEVGGLRVESKDGSKAKRADSKGSLAPSTSSKLKASNSRTNPTPPAHSHVEDTDSKNALLADEIPKTNVADREGPSSIADDASKAAGKSPLPKPTKGQPTEGREIVPALCSRPKGKLSDAKESLPNEAKEIVPSLPTRSKGKHASNSKHKSPLRIVESREQLPESKRDTTPANAVELMLCDVIDTVPPASPVAKRMSSGLGDDFSPPPPRSSKQKVADVRSPSPPHGQSTDKALGEVQNDLYAVPFDESGFASRLDAWRSSGDSLLAQGRWGEAISSYDKVTEFMFPEISRDKVIKALKNRDRVIQTLLLAYSHRSEAWIWVGNFENSLRDSNYALSFAGAYPKSLIAFDEKHLLNEVRRGRALHGLGEYKAACSIFSMALAKSPSDMSIRDLLEKSRICYEQSREGIYDLNDYFLNGCRGPPPPCSDFVGPVEIRRVLGKGRGLFLTRDVEAGELLLVSNPLAVVRRRIRRHGIGQEGEDYSRLSTKWRRSETAVGLEDFVERLSLLQSDRNIHQLYSLTTGDPQEGLEIPDLNAFIPGSQFELPSGWETLTSDLEKLRSIVRLNAIDGGLNPLDGAHNQVDEDEAIGCVGLWALPSFINHSCAPNCHMIDIGNAMFVRASCKILAGRELTRAYFDVYQNGLDRQRLCDGWLFVCNCERCVLEKGLTCDRMLPLHEYRKLLERVREESVRRLQKKGKDRSLSLLLPNPQPALLELRNFADWFDRLLAARAEDLGNKERAWIGASHLEAYVSRFHSSRDRNQLILALEILLEFMTNTAILCIDQAENAIHRAALLLDQVEVQYGPSSKAYRRIETRVLDLYETAYGKLRKDVLLTISRLMASSSIRSTTGERGNAILFLKNPDQGGLAREIVTLR